MRTNFSFLKDEWQGFFETARSAEEHVNRAPMYSGMLSRKSLEEFVRWMYDHDKDLTLPYDTSLNALIHEQSFKDNLPEKLFHSINYIRKTGNNAVHGTKKIKPDEALHSVRLLHQFAAWVVNIYGEQRQSVEGFNTALIEEAETSDKSKEQLQKLDKDYLANQDELKRKQAKLEEQTALLEELKRQLEHYQAIKQRNASKVTYNPKPTEAKTRQLYINALLEEAGWDPYDKRCLEIEVLGMPDGKTGNADYVLWGDDGLPLAVIEAKRTTVEPERGRTQAQLYANCLQQMYGQRPVIFYSNGFSTWIWDDTYYAPRRVQGFYKKDELQLLIHRRETRGALNSVEINTTITERYYQHEAIRRVNEAFENKHRTALLVMSTGTGKTRVAASIVDVLTRASWAKRVLFIADRNALVTQAKKVFNKFLPNLAGIDLTREKEDEASRVVFTTYQTLMNRIDGERTEGNRFYGVGHFDLVIFDEIHRSVYKKYRYVFEYFDALKLGLTATPRDEMDRNTYEVLALEDHNPTFAYELDAAIDDKFLVPPKAVSVPLKFPRKGIKYSELSPKEKEEYEEKFGNPETGEVIEEIDPKALNEWLFNSGTVDKVLQFLMDEGIKVEAGNKLGKTIIFARNHRHAMFIEERFNKLYPQFYSGNFIKIIDNYDKYAQTTLSDFSLADKLPQIAISVDMLDTGIDIPEIVNLVFFKPVKSRIKFWQMVGRGTRLCLDLFAPGEHKTHFNIFDFCENLEFFDMNPEGIEPRTQDSLTQRLFKKRVELASAIQNSRNADDEDRKHANELLDFVHRQVYALDRTSFMVQREIEFYDKYQERNSWDSLTSERKREISDHLAPILLDADETNELAKRVDMIVINAQMNLFTKSPAFVTSVETIQNIVAKLLRKSSIPMVAEKLPLLKQIVTEEYWKDVTINKLEFLRKEIRDLAKFIDKDEITVVYTRFEDSYDGDALEFDIVPTATRLESYKHRVERIIRENQHNITINRLRNNQPITSDELNTLEELLFEGDASNKEKFREAYGDKPLGVFIRSLLGMDVNAAKEAFSEFLTKGSLTGDQIKFINTIIEFFNVSGSLDKKMLFDRPFTEINDQGLMGVFDETSSVQILSIVDRMNKNALGA